MEIQTIVGVCVGVGVLVGVLVAVAVGVADGVDVNVGTYCIVGGGGSGCASSMGYPTPAATMINMIVIKFQ